MRAIVLGCGEMGREVVRDLHRYAPVEEIIVGTRRPERIEPFLGSLGPCGPKLTPARIDLGDAEALAALLRGAEVAVNAAGPSYRFEVPVGRAALAARVSLVDLDDEPETTLEMLALDAEARTAGVTVVVGLGGCPGVDSVLVRAAADQLDTVEEIHAAWTLSARDPGGPAFAAEVLRSMSHRGLTVDGGRLVEVESFVDGEETASFPAPVGPLPVWHVGHAEPLVFSSSFPGARVITLKGTFNPPALNAVVRALGREVRERGGPVGPGPRSVAAMDEAAEELLSRCAGVEDVPREAALLVEVEGTRCGRRVRAAFSAVGLLAPSIGTAAAIGAAMILDGRVCARGVLPPERCVDPAEFLYELVTRRKAGTLNAWVDV